MSGHSKWAQIKHKKEATDKKRAISFSKILKAISAAARHEPNPDFNPRLRTMVEKAREANVPQDNIQRALNRAQEAGELNEVVIEAYGPEGVSLIIEAITNNSNRTIQEVRLIFNEFETKMATPGSVMWNFQKTENGYKAKYSQNISETAKEKLSNLIEKLEENDDVQKVTTNATNNP